MILSFSGDPFLASRAARQALRARGFRSAEITELAEEMRAQQVAQLLRQAGLFGQVALFLDFDAAFKGQAGVKPRNEVMKVLEQAGDEANVVILDLAATPARQKQLAKFANHEHLPTPRFQALTHWVRAELSAAGVSFDKDVPEILSDLFGEDLPSIAAEIQKLAVLGELLDSAQVREIVNRPAARDAFDLIEAITQKDAARALGICQNLMAQGEAPPRILGAVLWQYNLITRCVGLMRSRATTDASLVVQTLKVKPFVAQKALAYAKGYDEARLRRDLGVLLAADVAMKTGRDEVWALERVALELIASS